MIKSQLDVANKFLQPCHRGRLNLRAHTSRSIAAAYRILPKPTCASSTATLLSTSLTCSGLSVSHATMKSTGSRPASSGQLHGTMSIASRQPVSAASLLMGSVPWSVSHAAAVPSRADSSSITECRQAWTALSYAQETCSSCRTVSEVMPGGRRKCSAVQFLWLSNSILRVGSLVSLVSQKSWCTGMNMSVHKLNLELGLSEGIATLEAATPKPHDPTQ